MQGHGRTGFARACLAMAEAVWNFPYGSDVTTDENFQQKFEAGCLECQAFDTVPVNDEKT